MNLQSSGPPRLRWARGAAVITVIAATALLAAACSSPATGSGGSPGAGGSANPPSAAVWVQCMRSHGVPDFPGPGSNGVIPKVFSGQQVGVSDSQLNAAQGDCRRLWPYQAPTQAQPRQELTNDLKFARCMRSHGLPGFPDPTNSNGRVEFVFNVSRDGFNPETPPILAKAHECQHVLPPGSPLPSASVSS